MKLLGYDIKRNDGLGDKRKNLRKLQDAYTRSINKTSDDFGILKSPYDLPSLQSGIDSLDYKQIQDASIDVVDNNGFASNIIHQLVRGVVGYKVYSARFNDVVPRDIANMVSKAWEAYWGGEVDVSGRTGIESEIASLRSVFVDGDAIVYYSNEGLIHLGGRCLTQSTTHRNYNMNFHGVEHDQFGKHTEYYVKNPYLRHGNITRDIGFSADQTTYLSFNRDNGAIRGESRLKSIVVRLMATKSWDNNLVSVLEQVTRPAYVIEHNALNNHTIYDESAKSAPNTSDHDFGGDNLEDMNEDQIEAKTEQLENMLTQRNNQIGQFKRSSIIDLEPNTKLVSPPNETPSEVFVNFREIVMAEIIAGAGISKTQATLTAGGNFASARQERIGDVDEFTQLRDWWFKLYRLPIYTRWLLGFLVENRISLSNEIMEALSKPKWTTAPFAWVDPQKDIQAKLLAAKNMVIPMESIAEEFGYTSEEIAASNEKYTENTEFSPREVSISLNVSAGVDGNGEEGEESDSNFNEDGDENTNNTASNQ